MNLLLIFYVFTIVSCGLIYKFPWAINKIKLAVSDHTLLFFLAWAVWLSFPMWAFGELSFVRSHDEADSQIPNQMYILLQNKFPQWMGIAGGIDTVSGHNFLVSSYILHNPYFKIPIWMSIGFILFFQRFIASYFFFKLFHNFCKIPLGASLMCALGYSMRYESRFHVGFISLLGSLIAGTPMMIWFCHRGLNWQKSQILKSMLIGILMIATLSMNVTVNGVFLLAPVFIWPLFWRYIGPTFSYKEYIKNFFSLSFIAMSIWLVPILRVLLTTFATHRMSWFPETLTFANFFEFAYNSINVITLHWPAWFLLGVSFIFSIILKRPNWIVLLIITMCIFSGFTSIFPRNFVENSLFKWIFIARTDRLSYGLNFFVWTYIALFLSSTSASCNTIKWRYLVYRFFCFMGFCLNLCLSGLAIHYMIFNAVAGWNYRSLYYSPALSETGRPLSRQPSRCISFGMHPSYLNGYGIETADGYINNYPREYNQLWLSALTEDPNALNGREIDYFKNFGNRIYATKNVLEGAFKIPSFLGIDCVISTIPINNGKFTLTNNYQGQKTIVASGEGLNSVLAYFKGNIPFFNIFVYKNSSALPRFYLVSQIKYFETDSQILEEIKKSPTEVLSSTALLNNKLRDLNIPNISYQSYTKINIQIISYEQDQFELEVSNEANGILVVSNNYSPYWKAWINDQPTNIFRAQYAFQGIYLPSGTARLKFKYQPPGIFEINP